MKDKELNVVGESPRPLNDSLEGLTEFEFGKAYGYNLLQKNNAN